MPEAVTTTRWLPEPCIRCEWPQGSRHVDQRTGRVLTMATERDARMAEARHEWYCRQGLVDRGGKPPAAVVAMLEMDERPR